MLDIERIYVYSFSGRWSLVGGRLLPLHKPISNLTMLQ